MADPGPTDNGSRRLAGYDIGRLDDVSTRLARIEGRLDSFATTTQVSDAKYSMLVTWVVLGSTVVVGIVGAVIRFWPTAQ